MTDSELPRGDEIVGASVEVSGVVRRADWTPIGAVIH